VRSLSSVLHSALEHSYFMEGSTLALTMTSETVPQHRSHPNAQPYTTSSLISVSVTADKARMPVVSIPTSFIDRLQGAASSSSTAPNSHLNVLVALEPADDESSDSRSHCTLPTNEQVLTALKSMVASTMSTPSPSTPPTSKASRRGRTKTSSSAWDRRRLSISELPASSLTGASKSRNSAIYFANSPIFRALEGFLVAAISQLPYVAVYPHRDGIITSAEPQLVATEDQPLLLLFLLLSGREQGGLALPSNTFGQRLLL
jgi:hypothetical protein